jgi:hypothetical protein
MPPSPLDTLLSTYSPPVQALTRQARAFILDLLPHLHEQVDPADKLIAFTTGPKMADVVCVLMPLKAGVNLGLAGGAALPDPAGLLQGAGKRHRHVRLTTPADLDHPALRALLLAAAARRP